TIAVNAAPGSTLHPALFVYDGLQVVAVNDDSATNNQTSQITFQPQAGHTYSVVVGSRDGLWLGDYQLRTFIASIDPSGGLDVFVDPAVAHNTVQLDVANGKALVTVNGTTASFPMATFGSITLNGGDDFGDTIN